MSRIDDAAARDPFRPRAASSSPFPSVAFERARADATASLARGVPRIAVLGPAGVGKSALLAQLARDVAPAGEIAWLQPPALAAPDAPTLFVDEIDRLDPTTRAALLARAPDTRTIVAGIDDPTPTPDTVSVSLTPLEPHEVGPYVQHRLRNADLPLDLFDDEAIGRLGSASARVPRVLDALAGRALFAAKLDEADTVRAVHARQAIEEHAALLAATAAPVEAEIEPAEMAPAAIEPAVIEPAVIEPAVIDTALVLAADFEAEPDDELHVPATYTQPQTHTQVQTHTQAGLERPLVAERIWSEPAEPPPQPRRSSTPVLAAVAIGCFILGAALVLAARASDTADAKQLSAGWQSPVSVQRQAPPPQTAPQQQQPSQQLQQRTELRAPTEADAAYVPMPAALAPPPQVQLRAARVPSGPNGSSGSSSPAVLTGPQRVFVHYSRNDGAAEKAANEVAERLRAHGFRVAELRPVDVRINQASVRYFFDDDRPRSEALEREVDAFVREAGLAPRSTLLPMRYYEPKPRPGTVEVWLPSQPDPSR